MRNLRKGAFLAAVCTVALMPALALALDLGGARLISVTPVDGGCVSGPTGSHVGVWAWDIQPGYTYTITIDNVTECANGGTDPTLNVRLNSSIPGHAYTDLVAVYVAPGTYSFDYTLPANAWCTVPILYCTVPGEWLTTGLFVRRADDYPKASHLRASTWSEGCTSPTMILGPECGGVIGTEESSWGAIKTIYR